MSRSEELKVVGISGSLEGESAMLYMAHKETGQMSFEPIEEIMIHTRTVGTAYFCAESLGRQVRGYFNFKEEYPRKGEVDFVTPYIEESLE